MQTLEDQAIQKTVIHVPKQSLLTFDEYKRMTSPKPVANKFKKNALLNSKFLPSLKVIEKHELYREECREFNLYRQLLNFK